MTLAFRPAPPPTAATPTAVRRGCQCGREKDACDERVEDGSDEERSDVEDDEVGEVVGGVIVARDAEIALGRDGSVGVGDPLRFGEHKPRNAVDDAERPKGHDDATGTTHLQQQETQRTSTHLQDRGTSGVR